MARELLAPQSPAANGWSVRIVCNGAFTMRRQLILTAALFAATMLGGSAASANPIYIGYQINGGSLTLAAIGAGSAIFSGTVSNVAFLITGIGSPTLAEPNLASGSISARDNSGL